MNFMCGSLMILIIVFSLIVGSEYQYKNDRPIIHWLLGFGTGIVSTLLFILGIWG